MIIPQGDHSLRYYREFIDIDLDVLFADEEIVQRAAALYRNRLLTTRSGSLLLTSERLVFVTPRRRIARWRNCLISLPLARIVDLKWRRLRPAILFTFPEQIAIYLSDRRPFMFSVVDAYEWCGAIQHQCELAGHRLDS